MLGLNDYFLRKCEELILVYKLSKYFNVSSLVREESSAYILMTNEKEANPGGSAL
jgi:hypothetical protein